MTENNTTARIMFVVRITSAIACNALAVIYLFRSDFVPAVIFFLVALLLWVLAFRGYRPLDPPGGPKGSGDEP